MDNEKKLIDLKAQVRLNQIGDFKKLNYFDSDKLMEELGQFKDQWKPYNPRKKISRYGLSVTSLDGSLSGVPDLDSLSEYNRIHGTNVSNKDINKLTEVYHACPTLQKLLTPWLPYLTRCHFIRLDQGGFFPDHIDCAYAEQDPFEEEIRLLGMVNNCSPINFKLIYDSQLKQFNDGELFYFNANKEHCVFSTEDNSIQFIAILNFSAKTYAEILRQSIIN
jgi:hypothetical protein